VTFQAENITYLSTLLRDVPPGKEEIGQSDFQVWEEGCGFLFLEANP
jgi:hypothetical protein